MDFKLSQRSLDRLKGVDPDLVEVVKRAIDLTEVDFGVSEGLRTLERQKELEKRAFEILSSGFERIPTTTKSLSPDAQEEVLQLLERIEEDDDVQNVFHNMN